MNAHYQPSAVSSTPVRTSLISDIFFRWRFSGKWRLPGRHDILGRAALAPKPRVQLVQAGPNGTSGCPGVVTAPSATYLYCKKAPAQTASPATCQCPAGTSELGYKRSPLERSLQQKKRQVGLLWQATAISRSRTTLCANAGTPGSS